MSDTKTNATQWPIPSGTTIPARGYLLVWADGETGQNSQSRADVHASFSLAKGGEAIALFAPDGTVIDAIDFGPQVTDVSQGRFVDGAAAIYFMTNATPRAANYLFTPNTPPTLALLADKIIDEGSLLSFTCVASDTNVPAQTLTFSLDAGAPAGASLNATNGQFTWTPSEAQGPGVYPVTIRVEDSGSPSLSDSRMIIITVNEVNNAPSLAPLLSRTVSEGSQLLVTNSASDPDAAGQTLTFSLDPGAPAGMGIDPVSGLINWIPAENQGPGTYAVTVRVTDNGQPPLSDTGSLTVFVLEVNTPPELAPLSDHVVMAGITVAFTVLASDPDFPAQGLAFSLNPGAPLAANIEGTSGWFSWTPGPADAGTTNNIGVTVSDFGSPRLTASRSFVVVVMDELQARVSRSGDTVFISIASFPGRAYRLEYKDALGDPTWEPLGTDAQADGPTLTFTDETTSSGQRFYRVVLVQ